MEQTLEPRAELARAESLSSGGQSAVSWPAIFAGAFVAASVSLVLLVLGSGLGFASISPWPRHGVSGTMFAVTAAIWLIIMQWVSSAFGGYITGRLRRRWMGTHAHEVFFRDTAHGFVTWAVATVAVVATLATSVFSVVEGGVHAASTEMSAAAQGWTQGAGTGSGAIGRGAGVGPGMGEGMGSAHTGGSAAGGYAVDKLFRSTGSGVSGQAMSSQAGQGMGDPRRGDSRMEAEHIVANAWSSGTVSDADRSYLAELVAGRTGLSAADAEKRVDEFVSDALDLQAKAKAAADTARKAAAQGAVYTALAMLIGAFIASVSAALGGRLRDEHI
jgi:hypothetical protein